MAISGQNDNNGTMAEINVIPLVDVMLVLLVIMVTAPMMQQGGQVNLPKADTKGASVERLGMVMEQAPK
jgi:biopolymer transport protein TolR